MENKLLIYDDKCPFCSWYSSLFVRYGFLPPEGRTAFSTLDPAFLASIDFTRARNEIPLLDKKTGHVIYGPEALVNILGTRFPLIRKMAGWWIPALLIRVAYRFISYNRRVIIASKCGPGAIDCAPAFHTGYRLFFLLVFLLFNTLMLFPLQAAVFTDLNQDISTTDLQLAHFSLVMVNCLLATRFPKQKAIEYLGQVNMIAVITILLLVPLLLAGTIISLSAMPVYLYFALISVIVFKEYLRRMAYAGILMKNNWVVSINIASMFIFLLFVLQ
jgi:hypothetical protein